MIVNKPGRRPTWIEHLLLSDFLCNYLKLSGDEYVIIHHISENTVHRVQLELEVRMRSKSGSTKCRFLRYSQRV